MSEPTFPVATLAEAQEYLRRPFSPRAMRWKVQSSWPKSGDKKGGMLVAFIDARLVIERLDTVVGPLWSDHYEIVPGTKAIRCELTIDGVTRSDVGEHTHSTKATVSDALKRAAVHFGIGLPIYSLSRVMLDATANGTAPNGKPPTLRRKKDSVEITPEVEAWLRSKYKDWLDSGKNRYGDALDIHGGDEDAVGMEPEEMGEPVSNTLESAAKVADIQKLYESLSPAQRKGLSKAKFQAQLRAATESPEALEKLEGEIKARKK